MSLYEHFGKWLKKGQLTQAKSRNKNLRKITFKLSLN